LKIYTYLNEERIEEEIDEAEPSDEGEALLHRVDAAIRRLDVAEASIKSVARVLDMNAAYLGRLFKAKCGASLKDYIARERMETAKRLLRETDWKVYEIARRVGYLEVDMFYKRFKLYTGVSANRFRAEVRAREEGMRCRASR